MSELDVKIRIKIKNLEDVEDNLKNIKKRMKDLRPVWPRANESLKVYMIENFTAQGLPSGGWSPLDVKYGAWKIKNYPGAPILVKSGGLFAKILQGPDLDGKATSARFSFAGEIAKFHQYGTTKMPARKIIFSPEVWEKEVAGMIEEYVIDGKVG